MIPKDRRPHHSASSLVASHNFIGVAGFGVDVGTLRVLEITGLERLVRLLETRTLLAGATIFGGSVTVIGSGRGGANI